MIGLVLKKFNSLLVFSPAERREKAGQIEQMPEEGLLQLAQVLDEAIEEENKFLDVIVKNNPEFPKEILTIAMKAGAKNSMAGKLGKLKIEIKK